MSEYCTVKISLTFQMKDGSEIESKILLEDMKVRPYMFYVSNEDDVFNLLKRVRTGSEMIKAIDNWYNGFILDNIGDELNVEKVSPIQFDDVAMIALTDETEDGYGYAKMTFYYDPNTKECRREGDYYLYATDNYDGDSEYAEKILAMYNMVDTPPEEIARTLGISLEEVLSVIENADDEEEWDD